MRCRTLSFYLTVAAKHREPLMYPGNSSQLSFLSENSLEELIRAIRKFIKELMQCFTVPEKAVWKPTLQRFVFSRRMRKESQERICVKNLPLWGRKLFCLPWLIFRWGWMRVGKRCPEWQSYLWEEASSRRVWFDSKLFYTLQSVSIASNGPADSSFRILQKPWMRLTDMVIFKYEWDSIIACES